MRELKPAIKTTPGAKTGGIATSVGESGKQRPGREQRFQILAEPFNLADTMRQVAEIVAERADAIWGWDSCSLHLYSEDLNTTACVLEMDLIEGLRKETAPASSGAAPSPKLRQVILDGPQLILRGGTPQFDPEFIPIGDRQRPSASLMFVPNRFNGHVLGVLTIQSYSPKAYTEEDLHDLQLLADQQPAGAIQRIQAEIRLLRTEELYRRAIGGGGAVPYSFDYRTNSYTFMGEGIRHLIGYAADEINSQLWTRIIKESVMQGEAGGLDKQEAARRVHAGEIRTWRCDMRVLTREGRSRWISDASVQEVDESGRPASSMGILEDITERKQAEISALAFSKLGQCLITAKTTAEVARTLSQVAAGLFGWDAFAFYLYNPEKDEVEPVLYIDTISSQKTDVPAPQSLRQPSAVDRRILLKGAELLLRGGAALDPEAIPFGDASRPSASIMRSPVRLRAQVAGIVAVHSYTPNAYNQSELSTLQALADYCGGALERLRSDEALRASESQFHLVWDSSEDGMRLTDREGFILSVNNAYCRMVDKSRAALEGQLLSVVHSASSAEYVLKTYRERFESKRIQPRLEAEVTLWNGRQAWFELSNSALELPGQPPLLLSIFRDINQRKQDEVELERMHRQLLDVSRQAGMADVATSVLHNIGNVLNSVNVSSSLLSERVRTWKTASLTKAIALIQAHPADLAVFLSDDPQGRQLPAYLAKLAEHLSREQTEALAELASLAANVEHIKEIVAMQQSYAGVAGVLETLPVANLVEDALRLNAGALERHRVQIVREFAAMPPILVDKHKVLQILVNLIRNAKYALDEQGHADKLMTLSIAPAASQAVRISVVDNGIGIPVGNLTRIFEHGFTTRSKGHGFGLHHAALAAKELGGTLTVSSAGPGQGAAFTLELPLRRG